MINRLLCKIFGHRWSKRFYMTDELEPLNFCTRCRATKPYLFNVGYCENVISGVSRESYTMPRYFPFGLKEEDVRLLIKGSQVVGGRTIAEPMQYAENPYKDIKKKPLKRKSDFSKLMGEE